LLIIDFFIIIFGLTLGSFFNVVAIRLLKNESIAFPPSHCVNCNHQLHVLDLVPVFSYVFLQGKCRYCKSSISPLYPFGELLTAVSIFFIYKNVSLSLELIPALLLTILLVISLLILIAMSTGSYFNKSIAQSEGKISAGYYGDLVGKNYETVEAHFEAAGFTDIELIDLNDAGIGFWNDGKVEIISVGGDSSFDSTDWFLPDTKVVISYH